MKYIFLAVFALGFGLSGFTQETVTKVKTKTKREGPVVEKRAIKETAEPASTTVVATNTSSHKAYGTYHAKRHNTRVHRSHYIHHRHYAHKRHYHSGRYYARHSSSHSAKGYHKPYKMTKQKYGKGKYKVKYKS